MPIYFQCDECRKHYELADALAGRRVRCKQCGAVGRASAAVEPAPADRYALDEEPAAGFAVAEPVMPSPGGPPRKPKKPQLASGLWWLSTWPGPAMHAYRGVMIAMLLALFFVGPVEKLVLALVGSLLMIAPLIARQAVPPMMIPFRESFFVALMCSCIPLYHYYYRLTRDDLYRKIRRPPLTRGDYGVILLGLLFLPMIVLAVREVDEVARNPRLARNRGWLTARAAGFDDPAPRPERALPRFEVPSPPIEPAPTPDPAPQRPRSRRRPAPAGPEVAATPAEPPRPEPSAGSSGNVYSYKPDVEGDPAPAPAPAPQPGRRPLASPSARSAPRPAFGPDQTVTIIVTGLANRSASDGMNKAITALLKTSGRSYNLQSRTSGGRATFVAAPVDDPRAFVDRLSFGRVVRVEGRSIEVEANP